MHSDISYEQALIERQQLLEELHSIAHQAHTEMLAYGSHDPFVVDVPACDSCGALPVMEKAGEHNARWQVRCPGCKKSIQAPQRHEWQARLLWCERNLAHLHYGELPLFDLEDLPPAMARRRMAGIRRNLELRKSLARVEVVIAHHEQTRPPGKLYRKKLDAYLRWAMLALRLIKFAERQQTPTEEA